MIIFLLVKAIIAILGVLFSFLPVVDKLPWGVDDTMVNAVGQIRYLAGVFPPLALIVEIGLVYIGYRLIVILLRFFLGSRNPAT